MAMKWLLNAGNQATPDRTQSATAPASPAQSLIRSLKRRSLRLKKSKPQQPPVQMYKRKSDSFVNSQEWTVSRCVPDLRLGIVGSVASGKSALVHRYLTGSYMQEESPEGGRFKKEVLMDGHSHLLLIRDEGGPPELQFTTWVDAVIFVFSLENEASFNAVYSYYTKMSNYRNSAEIPVILVGTQDAISESNPRVIDDARARKLANDLKRCTYYETCATYGLNVERVFQDACQKIVHQRMSQSLLGSRPTTPVVTAPPHIILPPSSTANSSPHHSNSLQEGISCASNKSTPLSSSSYTLHKEVSENNNTMTVAAIAKMIPPPLDNLTLNPPPPPRDHLPTPTSTPTASRKNRRRSNLFTPSKKSTSGSDDKGSSGKDSSNSSGKDKGEQVGSGRAIPVKQGCLYKRSSKALNKEWKKKYVTLTDDGRITYHPSLHDYMMDIHGKEIALGRVTVKVPGQRPRGSRSVSHTNGTLDSAALASITNYQSKDKKHADKVTLMSYEVLKESGKGVPSYDDTLTGGNHSIVNGSSDPKDTPNVKKRHRRVKSSSVKNNGDTDECDGYEFHIVSLDNKQWHFEASSYDEREEWLAAIENQILNSLQGVESSRGKLRLHSSVEAASLQSIRTDVPGNTVCADCSEPNPDWASLNLGILVCIECSGIHRNLGSHISKVRSVHLDEWPPGHLAVMLSIGNQMANSIWEAEPPSAVVSDVELRKPAASDSRQDKERWAQAKYVRKLMLRRASIDPNHWRCQLIDATCRSDMRGVVEALVHGDTDTVNATVSPTDQRTALYLACAMGNLPIAQLLLWYNADISVTDTDGRTVIDAAKAAANRGQPECSIAQNLVQLLASLIPSIPSSQGQQSCVNPPSSNGGTILVTQSLPPATTLDSLPASVI